MCRQGPSDEKVKTPGFAEEEKKKFPYYACNAAYPLIPGTHCPVVPS